jgi:hypothetical protein
LQAERDEMVARDRLRRLDGGDLDDVPDEPVSLVHAASCSDSDRSELEDDELALEHDLEVLRQQRLAELRRISTR